MIISKQHRFVFTAIPKTGTHSVRRALRQHLGPDDMEQVRLFVEKQLPVPELAKLKHGHISLLELKPHMSPEEFAGYFKFAFVRNPFDRFVSFCAFMTREQDIFARDPKAVMRHFSLVAPPIEHVIFRPQHSFVTGENGELLADYIGRVEQMQDCYDEACRRIGIPTAQLVRVNSSRRGDYREYYDQQLIDAVANIYRRDLDLFGYSF